MRLCGIFDHRQPMSLSDCIDALQLCGRSIQMNRDDCFCPGRDCRFEPVGVQRSADRVDIDKDWCGADVADGPCSGYKSHRDSDDLVSWTNTEAAQSQMQCAGAAIQAHTMINSTVRREFGFELGGRRALSKSGGITNILQRL